MPNWREKLRILMMTMVPALTMKPTLRFGCREIAFMSEGNGGKEQQKLRRAVLITAPGSLKNQTKPGRECEREENGTCHTEHIGPLKKLGAPHGWGVGYYPATHLGDGQDPSLITKGIGPAYLDPHFDQAVERGLTGRVMFNHTRLAQTGSEKLENSHPFSPYLWMHNGNVPGAKGEIIQRKIADLAPQLLGGRLPKGETDTEATLFDFLINLKQLQKKAASLPQTAKERLIQLRTVFAQTLKEVMDLTPPASSLLKNQSVIDATGSINTTPSANFVFSNGQEMLAFRRGPKLYSGIARYANGARDFVISSEPVEINPIRETVKRLLKHTADRLGVSYLPQKPVIDWFEVPENHLVTHHWENGEIERGVISLKDALTEG